MSFRELRSFNERMRALGYPKVISMESFRVPNFDLVADIIYWLLKSYDPSVDISNDVEHEADRVIFMKSAAQFLASKANLKLNVRKLYTADGYAVKELIKVANLLYDASKAKYSEDDRNLPIIPLDISSKLPQLKMCRALSSEITSRGAELYELLGKELELREVRTSAISRPLDLHVIGDAVKEGLKVVQDTLTNTIGALDNLAADEANLESKIEKKKVELERREKRLKSLQSVRPAFMDEFEKLEIELQSVYGTYMQKYRNLTYLEQQLEEYNRLEQDKFEQTEISLRKMQNRLKEEELKLLRHHGEDTRPTAAGSEQGRLSRSARIRQNGRMENGAGSDDSDEASMDEDEADLMYEDEQDISRRSQRGASKQRGNKTGGAKTSKNLSREDADTSDSEIDDLDDDGEEDDDDEEEDDGVYDDDDEEGAKERSRGFSDFRRAKSGGQAGRSGFGTPTRGDGVKSKVDGRKIGDDDDDEDEDEDDAEDDHQRDASAGLENDDDDDAGSRPRGAGKEKPSGGLRDSRNHARVGGIDEDADESHRSHLAARSRTRLQRPLAAGRSAGGKSARLAAASTVATGKRPDAGFDHDDELDDDDDEDELEISDDDNSLSIDAGAASRPLQTSRRPGRRAQPDEDDDEISERDDGTNLSDNDF